LKKIIFVHYGFEVGGICTSLVNFVSELSKKSEYEISVLFLNGDEPRKGEIPDNVCIEKTPFVIKNCFSSFSTVKARKNIFGMLVYFFSRVMNKLLGKAKTALMLSKFSKIKKEYDYAIAFANDIYSPQGECLTCGCNQFVANGIKAKKKLAWIHAMSTQIGYTSKNAYGTYKTFDGIVNCNAACKQIFDGISPVYKDKSFFVNNILNEEKIIAKSESESPFEKNVFNIVTVARVENATKRLDRIVPTVKLLKDKQVSPFVWHIVGDGRDKQQLEEQIQNAGLGKYIVLHGMKVNPYPYMANADLYVQTSDYEAMPMVIMEAELFEVPIVSTNYPAATEMIPESFGIVCKKNDPELIEEMADGISYMMQHRQEYNDVKLVQHGMDQLISVLEKV